MKRLIIASLLLAQSALGTLLVNETFEGTGTPSGWNLAGSANYDYTASPLVGSQSLRMDAATGDYVSLPNPINQPEVWIKLTYKVETLPSGFQRILVLFDSGVATQLELLIGSGGGLAILDIGGGNIFSTTSDNMSAGTIYDIWCHYKKGTGANGICEASFDVTGSARPNAGAKWCGGTNAASTADILYCFLGYTPNSGVQVIDNFQMSDTDAFAGGGATPTPTVTPTATPTAAPASSPSNRFFLFPQ